MDIPTQLANPTEIIFLMKNCYPFNDNTHVMFPPNSAPADCTIAARKVLGVNNVEFSHLKNGAPIYKVA